MIKFVVGSGDNRKVIPLELKGKVHHEQRRALKMHLGLIQ